MFKTFENYVQQFEIFINSIQNNGILIFNKSDNELVKVIESNKNNLKFIPYSSPKFKINNGVTYIDYEGTSYKLNIFGDHNLQNIGGALHICNSVGIKPKDFYKAITSFSGASNRLELIYKSSNSTIFKDFAHSPSKVKATSEAVRKQFPQIRLIA